MSLITRCPACGTLFRVVPDQLKMSEGWVRCGQCAEVFDAQASLMQAVPAAAQDQQADDRPDAAAVAPEVPAEAPLQVSDVPVPAPEAEVEPEPQSVPEPAASLPEAASVVEPEPQAPLAPPEPPPSPADFVPPGEEPAPAAPDFADTVAEMPSAAGLELGVPTPDPQPSPDAVAPVAAPPAQATATQAVAPAPAPDEPDQAFELSVPPGPGGEPERVSADHLELHEAPSEPAASGDGAPPVPEPSFVRQARRRALWSRPAVRVALVVLSLLAGLLLAAQVALHDRDRLAARVPALAPALQAACRALGCRIGPPRRIEAILIDNSAFVRLGPGAYRLNVTLANQAAEPVALPSLELTLTDAQDQPVLRRVLSPADLGPGTPAVLAARGQWPATVNFAVAAPEDAARIAGYRLLAFYP